MDFSLSEEQIMFKQMARDFLEKECSEKFVREIEAGDKGYSAEQWQRIADLGWLGFIYPEEYHGSGGSILDMAVLYEEMGRAMFPSPHLSTVVLCGLAILSAGSLEQKADLLPRIAKGNLILALALTEPQASWDGKAWEAEGITVSATAEGDNYVINGTKLFVPDAKIADYILCVTRTKDSTNPEDGITLFLVAATSPGITCSPLVTTAGDKQCEVIFDKVKVPKKNMVGELHKGWATLEKVLQKGAVLLCAQMVGASQKLLELTVDYAKSRIQFEQPIGVNQYVQEYCVMLLSEVESSWWLTYSAAWKLSEGLPADMDVAMAKAWVSDAHERVCWRAHQVYGGVGYTVDDGVLPLYSRRGKALQLYLGDAKHHLKKVTQELDKWPEPIKPEGKPLGLWDGVEEQRIPDWFERFVKGEGMEEA